MKQPADFSRIPARHDAINLRLEHWGQWVSVKPQGWGIQPMFRQYRSHAWQWHMPEIKAKVNTLEASETERAVSHLQDPHRSILRWLYVWPWVPVNAVRRDLGLTRAQMIALADDARDLVINRLREKC